MKYLSSTSKPPVRLKSGIIVRDLLLVLFSLLCLGGAAAMIYQATLSPSYETQAKLLVQLAEGGAPQAPGTDLNVEQARLESLEAKNKVLTDQLVKVDAEVGKISAGSLEFANLERRRQLEEEKYRNSEISLDKARVDEALNPASMPNISVVQKPSTPVRSLDGTSKMIAVGLAACGLLLLLGIAFGKKD